MAHTPGLWTVSKGHEDNIHAILCQDRSFIVADVYKKEVEGLVAGPKSAKEAKANANLIAAAPELLDALEAFVVLYKQGQLVIEGDAGNDPVVAKALAAIAKATGKS